MVKDLFGAVSKTEVPLPLDYNVWEGGKLSMCHGVNWLFRKLDSMEENVNLFLPSQEDAKLICYMIDLCLTRK